MLKCASVPVLYICIVYSLHVLYAFVSLVPSVFPGTVQSGIFIDVVSSRDAQCPSSFGKPVTIVHRYARSYSPSVVVAEIDLFSDEFVIPVRIYIVVKPVELPSVIHVFERKRRPDGECMFL